MTKRAWILLLLISGCASTPPPHHEPPKAWGADGRRSIAPSAFGPACLEVEVGPGPYDFDVVAASLKYAERCVDAPHGASTVKGFIEFISVEKFVSIGRKGGKSMAAAAVELRGSSSRIDFSALVFPWDPGKIKFLVTDENSGRLEETFGYMPFSQKPIPFALRLDESGLVQVSIGGRTGKTLSVAPFEMTRVRVRCSGAHVRFSNIEITTSDR
jgi:hypothetical protein